MEQKKSRKSSFYRNERSKWCEENAEKPMSPKTVLGYLKQNAEELGIEPSTNIPIDGGKKARGERKAISALVKRCMKER